MRALAFLALLLVGGCVSNWQMTYKSMLDGVPLAERTDLVPHEGPPRHVVGSDLAEDTAKLKSLGYVVIGYSSFNSAVANKDMAIYQGERVGAAVVLTISSFSHESEQTISVPVQDVTATTVDDGKVTSASGQTVDYHGTTTTTVEGLTRQESYTVNVYHHTAVYFVKRRSQLGIGFKNLPEEVYREIGRRIGVVISFVEPGSPAYHGDLFSGDVVIEINGEVVRGASHAEELIGGVGSGEEIALKVFKKGSLVDRSIEVP